MNAVWQPQVRAIQGITIGAMMGPKFEPELNKLVAKVRSLLGNQSATVLIDDGKLPASLIPREMRATKNPLTLDTNACPMAARLQPAIEWSSRFCFLTGLPTIRRSIRPPRKHPGRQSSRHQIARYSSAVDYRG